MTAVMIRFSFLITEQFSEALFTMVVSEENKRRRGRRKKRKRKKKTKMRKIKERKMEEKKKEE